MILSSVSIVSDMFSYWHIRNSETGSFPLIITTSVCFQLINMIRPTWLECTKTPVLQGIVGNISCWSMYLSAVCVFTHVECVRLSRSETVIAHIYHLHLSEHCALVRSSVIMSRCSLSDVVNLHHCRTDCRNRNVWKPHYLMIWNCSFLHHLWNPFLPQKIMLL